MGEITEGRTELEARRQVLLFFFALASRPDLVRQIEENGVLAGGKIDHDNLFQTTSRALTLHQLLASGAFVDREMTSLWQLFAGQDTGEEMDSYPVAEEFGPFADRRVVSPLTRMEFQFRAGTPAFYLGTDKRRMLVQDLVTVPGSRDPFSVTPASSFSLVREYSPLVAVLTPVREEDWAVVSGLGEAFVDTLAILGDPIEARFLGVRVLGWRG